MIHNLFKDILMALCQHVAHNSTGAWSGYDRVCTYAVINNVPNDSDCQMPSSERCILISEMSKCEMCTRILEIMGFNKQVGLLPWCARRPAYRCSESAVAASWRFVLRPRQTTNSPSHTRAFKASAPFRMYCPFSGSPSSFLLFAVSTILTKKKKSSLIPSLEKTRPSPTRGSLPAGASQASPWSLYSGLFLHSLRGPAVASALPNAFGAAGCTVWFSNALHGLDM